MSIPLRENLVGEQAEQAIDRGGQSGLRICFIAHQSSKEGAGRFLLDEIDYLVSEGISVFAIVPEQGPLFEALVEREIPVKIVWSPWWTVDQFPLTDAVKNTLRSASLMMQALAEWCVDVVYTNTIVIPVGALAAMLLGKPHVWHIHEFSYNPAAICMQLPKEELAALLRLSTNLIVFNSEAVASEWVGSLGERKHLIVKNWISDSSAFALTPRGARGDNAPRTTQIAIVGSVIPWKRQFDAVKAVSSLLESGFDVELTVIGPMLDSRYSAEIAAFVKARVLEDKVRLVGYVDNPIQRLKDVDIVLVCSELEPFGRVTIEAMSIGVPIIGTNSGGTPEIIQHGHNGLLYEVGDIAGLAQCIESLIADRAFRSRLGAAAQLRAQDFASAENQMRPLVEALKILKSSHNPSWPLGVFLSGLPAEVHRVHEPDGRQLLTRLGGKCASAFARYFGATS